MNEFPAQYISLDDEVAADTARADPRGFVAKIEGPTVIDEVQRAPGRSWRSRSDSTSTRHAGNFCHWIGELLTLPTIADALPGRVEYVRLWPFSQGELHGVRERFIDVLLGGRFPNVSGAPVGRPALAGLLATGGYPD